MTVIRYLMNQREVTPPVTGFTHSILDEPSFQGTWWDKDENGDDGVWQPDPVVLFIIDYAGLEDAAFERSMLRLRRAIRLIYALARSRQKDVWLLVQPATRYT